MTLLRFYCFVVLFATVKVRFTITVTYMLEKETSAISVLFGRRSTRNRNLCLIQARMGQSSKNATLSQINRKDKHKCCFSSSSGDNGEIRSLTPRLFIFLLNATGHDAAQSAKGFILCLKVFAYVIATKSSVVGKFTIKHGPCVFLKAHACCRSAQGHV